MDDELVERFRKWMYFTLMILAVSVVMNIAGCAVIVSLVR
jgi:hypothetical protein